MNSHCSPDSTAWTTKDGTREDLQELPHAQVCLRSSICRGLLEHWNNLRTLSGRTVPSRRQLDPLNIAPSLLPHLFLCEYLESGKILIRLQGTYLTDQAGQTLTGRLIDASTFGDGAPAVLALYETVRHEQRPIGSRERVMTSNGFSITCEVLHLPLSRDDGSIGFVVGALDRIDAITDLRGPFAAKAWDMIQVIGNEA